MSQNQMKQVWATGWNYTFRKICLLYTSKELLDNGVSLIVDDGVKTIEEKQITLASGKTVPADAVIPVSYTHLNWHESCYINKQRPERKRAVK